MGIRKFIPAVCVLTLVASGCGAQMGARVANDLAPAARLLPGPADRGENVRAVTFALWSSRDLPGSLLTTARALDGVVSASPAYSGTADLRSVGGKARRPGGHILPVSVIAVAPGPLRFSGTFAPVARALEGGQAALNATAATLRKMTRGTTFGLGKRDARVNLRVGSVMRSDSFFDHELVVPIADAKTLDITAMRAIIVAAEAGAVGDITKALVEAAGDQPVRVRALEGRDEAGTVLPYAKIKQYFGEFPYVRGVGDAIVPDRRWVDASIVNWKVPVLGTVRCHRNIIGQLAYAMHQIQAEGLDGEIESYEGCYVPRFQRGDPTQVSAHAWGIAIDVNAQTNGMGENPTLHPRVVAIMKRWGFAWGGDFMVPDGMHFEFSFYPPKSQFARPLG